MRLLDRLRGSDRPTDDGATTTECGCVPSFQTPAGTDVDGKPTLVVDADDCPEAGDLAAEPACRATVVGALTDRDADAVRVRYDGRERVYDDGAVGLLVAAGQFAARAAVHDETLAARARRDPLGAAHEATGRAGAVANLAATSGLAAGPTASTTTKPHSRPPSGRRCRTHGWSSDHQTRRRCWLDGNSTPGRRYAAIGAIGATTTCSNPSTRGLTGRRCVPCRPPTTG
nr:hypothetical protein [Haloplanus natans]